MTFTAADVDRAARQREAAARREVARQKRAIRKLASVLRRSSTKSKGLPARTRTSSASAGRGSYDRRGVTPGTILKIGRGGFSGDQYDEQKYRARLLDTNMLYASARERAAEWALDAASRPGVAPGRLGKHISISRPPGHDLADRQWTDLARAWLDEIGARGARYTVHKHEDEPQPHIHLVFSRVLPGGGLVSDSWERLKWREGLRRAEARLGLEHEIPRPANRPSAPGDRAVAAQRRAERRGTAPAWVDPSEVRAALVGSRDLEQFARALKTREIEMQVAQRPDGTASGLLLRAAGSQEFLAATSISRDLSLQKVQARLASANPTSAHAHPHPQPPPRMRTPTPRLSEERG